MRIAVLIAILSIALSYRTTQYEGGNQVIVQYGGGHILQLQAAVPRSVVVDIKFKKPFQVAPQVFISAQLLDWAAALPHGYIEKVSDITTTGFKLTGSAVCPSPLFSLFVDWHAIYDPRVAVVTFETTDVKEMKQGQGERVVKYTVPHNLKEATNGIISLIGVKHIVTNPIIEIKVDQITPQSVTVAVRQYWLACIEYVSFNVLLGTDQSLWSSPTFIFYNDPASSHPFVKRGPGLAEAPQSIELPKVWQSGPRVGIVTLRGYDLERATNMRLQYNKVTVDTKLNYNIATWWDTKMYGVFHQAAVYVADSNFKIFDPDCSELFSEPNYGGDSITVCDRIPDLPGYGWSKPIRSLTVPVSRRLYLFNKERYDGQRTSYIVNQPNLESITFSFAQLQSYNEEENPTISSQ